MLNKDDEDIDQLREKNEIERNAFLASVLDDPLFSDTVKELNIVSKQEKYKTAPKPSNKRKRDDSSFRFTGYIPIERRKSTRLQNKKPEFTYKDLPEENENHVDSDSIKDLEEVVFQVKKSRRYVPPVTTPRIIPVEEVTDKMIKDIYRSGIKIYGPEGTSCHQCRQKTVDTKTICRSGYCVGVRGQFCGICVINRYGEDPAVALKDPNWKCYVCRGCCNCSFCRLKEGKRPTGILAPLAKTNGYKSVQDLLISLKGFGDHPETDLDKDPDSLLGFNGTVPVFLRDKQHQEAKDPENLLGFDGNVAVMIGHKEELTPSNRTVIVQDKPTNS